jgi:hypothetical protein
VREGRQPEELEHAVGLRAQPGVTRAEQAAEPRAAMFLAGQEQVLAGGETREYLQELERPADAQAIELGGPQSGHVTAVDGDAAARRQELPQDAVE